MNTKSIIGLTLVISTILVAGCKKDDKEIFIDNPNKVLKTVDIKASSDSGTYTNVLDFHYDSNKRVTYITSSKVKGKVKEDPDFKIEYTYDNLNRVQTIRHIKKSEYSLCTFIYNSSNLISEMRFEGVLNRDYKVNLLVDNYFNVIDIINNEVEFTFYTSEERDVITSLQRDESSVNILYDNNLKNGHTNFGTQIGIPTYLFTELFMYSLTHLYPSVFDAKVVKEINTSKGEIMVINNESDNLGFVTKSTYNYPLFNAKITFTFTYQLLD